MITKTFLDTGYWILERTCPLSSSIEHQKSRMTGDEYG